MNEERAAAANSPAVWTTIWREEGDETWRATVLEPVYDRIVTFVPKNSKVVDIGGGVGILGARLMNEKNARVTVVEHNQQAVIMAHIKGMATVLRDVELEPPPISFEEVVVATEVLEHLSMKAVRRILNAASVTGKPAFFSVPNDRLGPEEEPQHARKWTALEFLSLLREYWGNRCRVEVIGGEHKPGVPAFLLGICGIEPKAYTLSVTLPVRDEAVDLEAVLASFRGVADEIVVGVDYRTKDTTREVAAKYAEVVFDIDDPRGPDPEKDKIPENGVHFSHVRNRCMKKCSKEWIFMTEGHERLKKGEDVLLQLDAETMRKALVAFVWRTGQGQRWGYPWLCKNDTRLHYERPTHNQLWYPQDALCIRLPQVETWHFRDHAATKKRAAQRKVQNRITLLDDWKTRGNSDSLYYLANETREFDKDKAIERLEEFLALPPKNGPSRYQARLSLAYEYAQKGDRKSARRTLIRAQEDDWSRVEHWVWLGDLAFEEEQFAEALQFYRYAAASIGDPPFSLFWVDDDMYSYVSAQRMAMALAQLGRTGDALEWARKVVELLPEDAPQEAKDEAVSVVTAIEEHQKEIQQ